MTITINDNRRPLGMLTWVAYLRDGRTIAEFEDDHAQRSVDLLVGLDVAQLHLIPINGGSVGYTRIDAQEGETIHKKWVRTFTMGVGADGQENTIEHPVVDAYVLRSDKPVWHYAMPDGSLLITTNEEF